MLKSSIKQYQSVISGLTLTPISRCQRRATIRRYDVIVHDTVLRISRVKWQNSTPWHPFERLAHPNSPVRRSHRSERKYSGRSRTQFPKRIMDLCFTRNKKKNIQRMGWGFRRLPTKQKSQWKLCTGRSILHLHKCTVTMAAKCLKPNQTMWRNWGQRFFYSITFGFFISFENYTQAYSCVPFGKFPKN